MEHYNAINAAFGIGVLLLTMRILHITRDHNKSRVLYAGGTFLLLITLAPVIIVGIPVMVIARTRNLIIHRDLNAINGMIDTTSFVVSSVTLLLMSPWVVRLYDVGLVDISFPTVRFYIWLNALTSF